VSLAGIACLRPFTECIEKKRNSDVGHRTREFNQQAHSATDEEEEPSHEKGEQVKDDDQLGFGTRRYFRKPFCREIRAHIRYPHARLIAERYCARVRSMRAWTGLFPGIIKVQSSM
jgi:hypothetical protein